MAVKKAFVDEKLKQAYEQYYNDILKYCAHRLNEDKSAVDDCVQEVFLVYYNKMLSGEEIVKVRAFLYRTADIKCKESDTAFLRKAKRTAPLESLNELASTETESRATFQDYDKLKLLLLNELTEQEKDLYRLRYEQNKSLNDISKIYNIPPNTATKRLSRLRSKIKALAEPIIEKHGEGGVTL